MAELRPDELRLGMNLDSTTSQIKPGQTSYALNAAIEGFDGNQVTYQNEQSNEPCTNLPEGYKVIGTHSIIEREIVVYWLVNPTNGKSQIGIMDTNTCLYTSKIQEDCLNLSIDHPIHKAVHKVTACGIEIYWTDNYNPRRWFDLYNLPFVENISGCDTNTSSVIDCNKLNVQPNFKIPQIRYERIDSEGSIVAGSYQFAVQYSNSLGDAYTSYYSVKNGIPIADPLKVTLDFNYITGSAIRLLLSNIDTSGVFDYFNLAVIKTINNITSVDLVGTYQIKGPTEDVVYTGQSKDGINLTINDIFEKFTIYDKANDIEAVQDILIWDGLTTEERISFQKIANKIKLNWQSYIIPYTTDQYKDPLIAANYRGYMRDEVYPFEICFLYTNGYQTDGFHIPGREPIDYDLEIVDNQDVLRSINKCDSITEGIPRWKVYNTSSILGQDVHLCKPVDDSPPPPTTTDINGTVSVVCSDVGCTEQGEISLVFTFDSPTQAPLNLLIGQQYRTNLGGSYSTFVTGTDIFPPPGGAIIDPFYLDPSTNASIGRLPFQVYIPSGTTSITISEPIYLQGYNSGLRTHWICQSCQDSITDIFIKPIDLTENTLSLTPVVGQYNLNIQVIQDTLNPGTSPISTPPIDTDCVDNCYLGPYQYGEFAYWESTETYDCNTEVWGDLAGKPIRHHKFPDNVATNHFDSDGNIYPLGIRIDLDAIKAIISSSGLTAQQKSKIAGFKILRGNRANNKSVVAKGILYNVGQYFKENANYFYPNYPYNDLRPDPFIGGTSNAPIPQVVDGNQDVVGSTTGPDLELTSVHVQRNDMNNGAEVQFSGVFHGDKTVPKRIKVKIPSVDDFVYFDSGDLMVGEGTTWNLTVNLTKFGTGGGGPFGGPNFDKIQVNITLDIAGDMNKTLTSSNEMDIIGAYNADYVVVQVLTTTLNDGDVTLEQYTQSAQLEVPSVAALEGFSGDNSKNRFTFHSPDTSFYQPFLGDILKIDEILYGKSTGHFVEVKDHAKYKFPSLASYLTALGVGIVVGFASGLYGTSDQPFDGAAAFTTVQFLDDLIYKLIPRKNFTYQYNSIGRYTKYKIVPNDAGVKNRMLDIFSYLIPGVQGVGDLYEVNNYQRESSVYLRSTDPLPLITEENVPQDASRITISGARNCGSPGSAIETNIASYYGAVKRPNLDQYGKIYSYQTIDTGSQYLISDSGIQVAFGGDCFINRFAFKRKFPMFLDNRVGQPDDSDVFYDTLGNVGYPTYWFSTDIQKGSGGNFNIGQLFGVKVNNFDCKERKFFYDSGKIYLFVYGIPYFFCESEVNIDYRQAYNSREGDYYPHISSGIPDNWLQEINVSINNDNTYIYNKSLSKQNLENVFTHLPVDFIPNQQCTEVFPNKAIYSDRQLDVVNYKKNNWLIYRPASQFDFPLNYGKLISLEAVENRAIIARFENKAQIYNSLITIDTSNPQAAYIGNGKLFSSAPPVDFQETDIGFNGTQHKFFLKTDFGNISVDAKRGNIFLLNGANATDVSQEGLDKFFSDNLPFQIAKYFTDYNIDNHFKGVGLHGVYDTKYKRVIITKLDYKPIVSGITYDSTTDTFKFQGNTIQLSDNTYFCNVSWTLSFCFLAKGWVSFHTYIANYYIPNADYFYSGRNIQPITWRHNTSITSYNSFYGEIHPYIIEYPFIYRKDDEIIQSIQDYTKVLQYTDSQSFIETDDVYFNKCVIYNNQQSSGIRGLVPKQVGNMKHYMLYPKYNVDSIDILYTKNDNFYNFNGFWDIIKDHKKPLFLKSCTYLSQDKIVNQTNMNYTSVAFKKAPIRAKECKIRLILDNRTDSRLISVFVITDNQISYK